VAETAWRWHPAQWPDRVNEILNQSCVLRPDRLDLDTPDTGILPAMKCSICAPCAAALFIVMSLLALGRSLAAEPDPRFKAFFEAADPAAREAAIAAIVAAATDPMDVERALHQGRSYPADTKKGWQVFTHTGSDGTARPYHVYVPKGYDPARKNPVVVSLHGGVGRPNLLPEDTVNRMRADFEKDGDKYGWIIVVPLGQRSASWFNRVGMTNILAQLAAIKRRYNIDENRVFLGGFSDGASGSLIMGLYEPTPWAGFFALSGSIVVAGMAPDDAFPANLANRPVHAANGGLDPLYPSILQKMFIDQLKEQGARITWTDYPASGHDGSYMKHEDPKVNEFLLKTVRDPAPKHLVWETASPKVGRCDWVRIDEVRDVGNNRGPECSNLILAGPAQFAVGPDMSFAGPGVRIQQVPPGTLSQTAGLKPGDVVTRLGGVDIKTVADFQKVGLTQIFAMKKGDKLDGEYRRGDATQTFRVEVPELPRVPIFKRRGPAGRLEVSAKGNRIEVTARAVARYALLIRRGLFDLDQPIQVVTNGAESFNAQVKPDVRFMLEQAAEDDDRSAISCARIEIKVPPGAAPAAARP
jgi:predicted esterase